MRRHLATEKPVAELSDHLPDVAGPSALASNGPTSQHAKGVAWGPTTPAPKYLFTSPVPPARGGLDTMRSLDLRDKKKLRCIWLAPDEGDQQIVRPPPLDSMQYAQISVKSITEASMFGHNAMEKIKRADNLSVQLERSDRFMDAVHTYEQSAKMHLRCIQKREDAPGVMMEELKWLRIDYEIRCVQLVALCMCGARKTVAAGDNTAFLLLKKSEELTARDGLRYCKKHVQRAAVYQNMANYYKKQKKYQAALQAAEKAVRINDKLPPSDRFPIAYFLQACLHGLLQEPAKAGFMYTACLAVAESQRPGNNSSRTNEGPQLAEVFHTLKAATLHNLAIEWANLNMPDQTRDALASAMEVGVHYLPQTHPVVVRILETYKVMRENFLFHASSKSATSPVGAPPPNTSRPSVPVRPTSPPPLENGAKRPLPPKRSQQASHGSPGKITSPRARRISSREEHHPESEDISPMPPPPASRRPTSPLGVSPRARAVKRPTTTPEAPTGLSGQTLPPGATRTSHLWAVPDKIYSHTLGAKYNSHKERVLEEARTFGIRRRAARRIQKSWRSALMRHRALKRKENAATLIQSAMRMRHQKAQYDQTLHKIRRTQAVWRGGHARTHMETTLASVVQIQSAWRCRNERAKYAIKKIRLVLLQSVVRGFLARAARTRKSKAAAEIQAQMRRYLCLREFNKTLSAAATINRVLRGVQTRKQVVNAIKHVVGSTLKDMVESVVADDLLFQATKVAVEGALEDLVAIASREPEQDERFGPAAEVTITDAVSVVSYESEEVNGGEKDKGVDVVCIEPTNDYEDEAESIQTVDDGVENTSREGQVYEEEIPFIEAPFTVESASKRQTFPLLKSASDQAILQVMMRSTISKFIDASITDAIDDCSNDIQHGDKPTPSYRSEVEANEGAGCAVETAPEESDTAEAVNAAFVAIVSSEPELVVLAKEADAVAPDPEVNATVTAMVTDVVSAAEVRVEPVVLAKEADAVAPDPEVNATATAMVTDVVSAAEVRVEHAVGESCVSVIGDSVVAVAVHLEKAAVATIATEPVVDAAVTEVMAAVLSQVSARG
ncbi:hypothetical protein PHYPSEUDO_001659 [Phytophthora pseudosyringae]|uniref:Uncharacterized protein n=1 Tax=Phytophthora pseudosyringae TaxID=221518 RepID=A0A8T1VVE5_9STRA|nr:hypothetical protein PHYPSEUDO_001659 [Phytophthora pseudosyringae]